MLVLTRKPGQRIHVDERIVITVLDAGSGRLRIGIDAPAEVRVLRGELCEPVLAGDFEERTHAARNS